MEISDFYLLVIWFVTLVILYLVIRWGVADGIKDYHKKKNDPDDKEKYRVP